VTPTLVTLLIGIDPTWGRGGLLRIFLTVLRVSHEWQ